MPSIILASSSPYRRMLMDRLGLTYETDPPHIDEKQIPNESVRSMSLRLARIKATAVIKRHPNAIVIGSDQSCEDEDGNLLRKPPSKENAIVQLQQICGKLLTFYSALSVIDTTGNIKSACIPTKLMLRQFDKKTIENYLNKEHTLDCTAGLKIEALGITLVERVSSNDPTALIGLPLIALSNILRQIGIVIP